MQLDTPGTVAPAHPQAARRGDGAVGTPHLGEAGPDLDATRIALGWPVPMGPYVRVPRSRSGAREQRFRVVSRWPGRDVVSVDPPWSGSLPDRVGREAGL